MALFLVLTGLAQAAVVPARLRDAVASGRPAWVFLHDKGPDDARRKVAGPWVSERALTRIARRGGIIDPEMDRPIFGGYRDQLVQSGMTIRSDSRWLNAISGQVAPGRLDTIAALPFVDSIRPVALYRRTPPPIEHEALPQEKPSAPLPGDAFDYGPARPQIALIGVDSLHAVGLDGDGVRIGFLDTGYSLDIDAFDSLRLIATRDFINGDDDVGDGDMGQMGHGTNTLSLCAALDDGQLIGVAPRAEYLLAKTENVREEIQIEEDDWVEALWWCDSMGCDLISSSVGYTDWYVDSQFDGNTAVTTIAADLAAARGLLVVNAAGNAGCKEGINIIAPADGDSVLAVGASDLAGNTAGFSSCGPTFDGRIKPDVIAPGSGVLTAFPTGHYGTGSGTSFATPLVTGVCALMLQIDPTLTPYNLIELLRETASDARKPLNTYGWGLVRAAQAALRLDSAIFDTTGADTTVVDTVCTDAFCVIRTCTNDSCTADTLYLTVVDTTCTEDACVIRSCIHDSCTADTFYTTSHAIAWPNPASEEVHVRFPQPDFAPVDGRLQVFTITGGIVYDASFTGREDPVIIWPGKNSDGEPVAGGVYLLRVTSRHVDDLIKIAWVPRR